MSGLAGDVDSKADIMLRPQNDTRMNDQSVGQFSNAISRIRSLNS